MQSHEREKKTVKLGNVTLGAGMPVVCVPGQIDAMKLRAALETVDAALR